MNGPTALDDLLGYRDVLSGEVTLPRRSKLRFIGFTINDNPATKTTEITGGGGTSAVTTVFGRSGAVVPFPGDYPLSFITDDSTLAQGSARLAIDYLAANKANRSVTVHAGLGLSGGGDLSGDLTLAIDLSTGVVGQVLTKIGEESVGWTTAAAFTPPNDPADDQKILIAQSGDVLPVDVFINPTTLDANARNLVTAGNANCWTGYWIDNHQALSQDEGNLVLGASGNVGDLWFQVATGEIFLWRAGSVARASLDESWLTLFPSVGMRALQGSVWMGSAAVEPGAQPDAGLWYAFADSPLKVVSPTGFRSMAASRGYSGGAHYRDDFRLLTSGATPATFVIPLPDDVEGILKLVCLMRDVTTGDYFANDGAGVFTKATTFTNVGGTGSRADSGGDASSWDVTATDDGNGNALLSFTAHATANQVVITGYWELSYGPLVAA